MAVLKDVIKIHTKDTFSLFDCIKITKCDYKILNDDLHRKELYIKASNILNQRYKYYLANYKNIKNKSNAKFVIIFNEFNNFFADILLIYTLKNILPNDLICIIIQYTLRSDFISNVVKNIDHITLSHTLKKFPLEKMLTIIPYLLCSQFEIDKLKKFRIYIMIDLYNAKSYYTYHENYGCHCINFYYENCDLHTINTYKNSCIQDFCKGIGRYKKK
jgi:hypothetical protein